MASNSKIEWTNSTWSPLTGCDKISPGCKNCYAEKMALRLQAMGQKKYSNGFKLALHEEALSIPLKWKKSKVIFVNSMSDLFHKDVPIDFIQKIFSVMRQAHWHIFQILTKRSDVLLHWDKQIDWPENVWMGVSVENQRYANRVNDLIKTHAKIKFISIEPLLGPIEKINLEKIDWVIVGGESGPNSRPMKEEWVINLKNQCIKKNVPFFFKQWGGTNKKKAGRILENRTWDEMPKHG